MGRYSYSGRLVADPLHIISIYYLRKHDYLDEGFHSGVLTWSCRGEKTGSISFQTYISKEEKYIKLIYTITRRDSGKKDDFEYKIPIETTDCYFGGKRYWFRCNLYKNGFYCGHRVAKLYEGGDYFACRHCYNLTYASRNENPTYRHFPYREMMIETKIDELWQKMKKTNYKGKPTKIAQRIIKLKEKNKYSYGDLEKLIYK